MLKVRSRFNPTVNQAAAATHRVVPEEPVVAAEVRAEREDLAPAGRAAGVDGGRGERDEVVPLRRRVRALVPRGGRQHAAEGPRPARPARAVVGEGYDGEAEARVPDEAVGGAGQAPAAERVGAAEEERGELREEREEEGEREQEEEPAEAKAKAMPVVRGAPRPRPLGHRREAPAGRRLCLRGQRGAVQRRAAALCADFFPVQRMLIRST